MRIGEVADRVGLPARTIRFYERKGLLPEPERASNGYRVYGESMVERLEFIRGAQTAGLTLTEIASVIDVRSGGSAPCGHVGALLESKLAEVSLRRRELGELEVELRRLLERSSGLDPANCTDRDVCHILRPDIS